MTSMKKTQRMTFRRFLILLLAFIVLCVGGGVATSGYLIPLVWGLNNSVEAAKSQMVTGESVSMDLTALPQMSKIYAGDGKTLLAQFYTQNRQVVALKDISDKMQKAVVAREDRRFLDHSGIDPQGIARAFVNTYIKKGDTQGGSTLTQQYVKNVLLSLQAIRLPRITLVRRRFRVSFARCSSLSSWRRIIPRLKFFKATSISLSLV